MGSNSRDLMMENDMSDDERDLDNGSDVGDLADKRAHHNALERKRRDHIKDSFTSLRDSVPSLAGEKVGASRAQILKRAAEYISSMKVRNTTHGQDIDDLRKQNKILEEQIRNIEKAKGQGQFPPSIKSESISSMEGTSDSDVNSSDHDPITGDLNYDDENQTQTSDLLPAAKKIKTERN